jgi:hypothetical protein
MDIKEELLTVHRVKREDGWHSIHRSADGLVSVDAGLDDQRPDADGVRFFQPICVAEILVFSDGIYNRHFFCGACHHRMNVIEKYCPLCGNGIAHYVFAMGVRQWKHPSMGSSFPDVLPEDQS